MQEAYFTRRYEDIYGADVVASLVERLGGEAVGEAFFAVHAQIDLLVEEGEIPVADGQYYNKNDWTTNDVLRAQDEVAAIARKGNHPMFLALEALSACMWKLHDLAPLAPSTSFGGQAGDDETPSQGGDDQTVAAVESEIPAAEAMHLDRGMSSLGTVECGLWTREAPKRTQTMDEVTCKPCRAAFGR